jgi:GMP synthase (glutamine-hydrolysing) B subunit
MADEDAALLRDCSSTPRSRTRVQGKRDPGAVRAGHLPGAKPDWVMRDHVAEAVAAIREQVGDEEVILGLSGGVDSSVAAALIHRAIGDQLTCVFVDHGLLAPERGRHGDGDVRRASCTRRWCGSTRAELFLGKLAGVSDPEAKRKIIGGLNSSTVFKAGSGQAQADALAARCAKWLAQGTIYPDVIESGGGKSKKAVTIKSHHNVGGLPEQLGLKLLEPLRDLFKDEVRELGVALGLPPEMVYRHPFPGPGLGVRILGEVKKDYADLLRRADAIFIEELRNFKRRLQRQELVRPDQPGLHGVPAGQERGRDGRWPHLRLRGGAARGADQRLHDGRLGGAAVRAAEEGVGPHHQRGARHQPRDLRREQQAAGDHRVGVIRRCR